MSEIIPTSPSELFKSSRSNRLPSPIPEAIEKSSDFDLVHQLWKLPVNPTISITEGILYINYIHNVLLTI